MTAPTTRLLNSEVLLVIPAYEEVQRLPPFLSNLADAIAHEFPLGGIEILVVDDGSSTSAAEIMGGEVAAVADRFPFVKPIVRLRQNRGKGAAVYSGWDTASPETKWVAFVDADGAVSASETVRLIRLAIELPNPQPQISFFALRDMTNRHSVRRTIVRGMLGRVFAMCVRVLFKFPVADTQCGLKVVPRTVFDQVRPKLTEMRFCFDIELTALLVRAGVDIRGVPIDWEESPGSKVRFGSALRMLFSLISIRYRLAFAKP